MSSTRCIQTVLGPISPADLGVTLCHEHLAVDLSGAKRDPDAALTDESLVTLAVSDLMQAGGRAVIEVTADGMGRNVQSLRRISAATGCHVVCATGFYYGQWLPECVQTASVEELADRFEQELTVGITEGIRAGVIGEIGTSLGQVLPIEEKVFRAAALAQRRTGCPIMTHTSLGTMAIAQLDILEGAGADLSKVSISHQDLNGDVETHVRIARRGAWVQYDTVGKERYQPDAERIRMILAMAELGWAHRLMLSTDISRPSYLQRRGGYGYAYLLTQFVPQLQSAGIGPELLDAMLVTNPSLFLAY
jgi:predicted metal-dependent phosphotriesterase family hydrolase